MSQAARLVSVAVPVPFLDSLTYQVPAELDIPPRGARVLVPLGRRTITGIVVGAGLAPADGRPREIRDILDVLDDRPLLPMDVLDLALWVAEYYLCSPGDAIAAAMPPRGWIASATRVRLTERGGEARGRGGVTGARAAVLGAIPSGRTIALAALRPEGWTLGRADARRRRARLRAVVHALARQGLVEVSEATRPPADGFKIRRIVALTAGGLEAADDPGGAGLGERQRAALALLREHPDGMPIARLGGKGSAASVARRLVERDLATIRRERVERDPFSGDSMDAAELSGAPGPHRLTAEQASAMERLGAMAARNAFGVALLQGVTGSGKTEIYLRLAQSVMTAGRKALVLVPEIALTPAVAAIFRDRLGDRVAIQHSGLSDGERHDQWHRIRRGEIDVVVGTRSAVFAPIAPLGLVVVDEEHDASYKQEENPRYNGRDVAIMRAKQAGALAVLGSATPSLESCQHARSGRYALVALERRILDRPLAAVRIVDMRQEYVESGPDVVLSRPLRDAMRERLARGEQVLVLLNRRGFAVAVFCRQCGATVECPNCTVSLTVHRASRRARCHYCGYSTALPGTCPACGGPYLEQLGIGTERVEAEIAECLGGARVARLDRDTARRRGAVVALLQRFGRGEIDVLVGTQMIAKGHDFPRVTLVGVISADVGLGIPDFRAGERTFQLLTQVVGRAGRGEAPGEAVIQTLYPDHYSIRHACQQRYDAFFEDEIRFRREMRYPPAVAMANLVVRARGAGDAMREAADLARRLRASASGYSVLGPAPAPLEKLKGEHRAQVFLKGVRRAAMRAALRDLLAHLEAGRRRRVAVDVDPVVML